MGLFRNEKRDVEEALEGLLGNIGANYRFHEGVDASPSVRERAAKVKAAAEKMRAKGKDRELEAVVAAWYEKPPPASVVFRGDSGGVAEELARQEGLWADVDRELPPVAGSGPKAEAEEARRDEIAKMRAARDYWRSVLAGL